MNVFLDMSRVTTYAENMQKTCMFKKQWRSVRQRLTSDESKMFDNQSLEEVKIDVSDIAKPPQELKQTEVIEERKLIAY